MNLSLRARLVLVALVALVPLVGFFLLTRSQLRDLALEEAASRVVRTAEAAGEIHRSLVAEAEVALRFLASIPDLAERGPEECRELVSGFVEGRDHFTVLGVMRPDGSLLCSAPVHDPDVNVADRSYFREALTQGRPAASGYHTGRMTGRPAITLARPVMGLDAEVVLVAASGLDLLAMSDLMAGSRPLPGATATVFDLEGRILTRLPEGEEALGGEVARPLLEAARSGAGDTGDFGAVALPDLDGTDLVFGISTLTIHDGTPVGYVAVGMDPEVAYARVAGALDRNLRWLLLSAGVLFLGVLATVEVAVVRRILPLTRTAERLAAGDLSARTGMPSRQDELGRLAATLDRMAERLEELRAAEARWARDEIRKRDDRLRTIARVIDAVFWLLDRNTGRPLYVSDAYTRIWGRDIQEELDDPGTWLRAVHPEDRALAEEHTARIRRGADAETEFRILHPDGSVRWIRDRTLTRGSADDEEPSPGPDRLVRVSEDVTQRRELEEQVERSLRLEAVGRLAGGVAHDFNNILTSIQGHAEFVFSELAEDDPKRQDMEEIARAATRAGELTRQLLAFGRRQVMAPEVLRLDEVVREFRGVLERTVGGNIQVALDLAPDTGSVQADRGQLEQILLNLAVNAADAMPDGGALRLETRSVTVEPGKTRRGAGAVPPGEYVLLAVTDTGVGMDPQVQSLMFDPFFTTKGTGKGSGLGLSTVYGLAKQMEATITVRSRPGQGTTMELHFPRIASEDPEEGRTE